MTTNNIAIAKQLYAYAIEANWDEFAKLCHPDFAVRESPSLSYAGEYRGLDGFKEILGIVMGHYSNFEMEPTCYTGGDNYVIALVSFSGTGIKTGKEFKSELAEVFRFEDGKVIEIKPFYWDPIMLNEI